MESGIVTRVATQTRRQMYAAQTRAALLEAAEQLFVKQGYAGTSIADITRLALVSKGTYYHHFVDKRSAFAELFRKRIEAAAHRVSEMVAAIGTPEVPTAAAAATKAAVAYLSSAVDDEVHRELLRQAPGVLGHDGYRAIDEEVALPAINDLLATMQARGELRPGTPVAMTARLLLTCLCEATLLIAAADDRDAAMTEALQALASMFQGVTITR